MRFGGRTPLGQRAWGLALYWSSQDRMLSPGAASRGGASLREGSGAFWENLSQDATIEGAEMWDRGH